MKRSVIQLAGRTLLVSLPVKWADANGVHKGDELDVLEEGHKLVINTEAKSSIETADLNADKLGIGGNGVGRYIYALYKKGVDEINVSYSDSKVADSIRDALPTHTVGYEIVSQTPKSCVVKLITSGNITEFDNLLRRTFLLLINMSEETLDTIKRKDIIHLEQTALLEKPNNRLSTVCRRTLNKYGTETYTKVGPLYYIVEELENIADEFKHYCHNVARLKDLTIKPEAVSLLERVNQALRTFYEIFYKFDQEKLNNMSEARVKFMHDAHKLIDSKKLTPAEFYTVHHAIIMMQKIFGMTGPYLVLRV